MKRVVVGFIGVLGVLGCDKGSAPSTRVALSADESAMLAHLPAKNVALVGGNFAKLQKAVSDSALSRMMGSLAQSSGPGMAEWMKCYAETKSVEMLGAVKLDAAHIDIEYVMRGMDLAQLETCAKRAGFPTTLDADHKYLAMDFPSPQGPMKTGYLALPDGMLYTRASMQFGAKSIIPIDRATLEQDIASIATVGSAATDKVLIDQIPSVDRSKAVWFVGNGAGTPIADKVGIVYGTFDVGNVLAFDITAQVIDKTLVDQIAKGVPEAKQQAGMIGSAVKAVADTLVFNRNGDRLRFRLAIDVAQLDAMGKELAPFAQGAGMQ